MNAQPMMRWERFVLAERPSISLAAFRIAVAITVGCHVIPTLLQLPDNYLSTAFREVNVSFFPIPILQLIHQSPDALVHCITGLFYLSWGLFLIGYRSQLACIVMTACCYYLYALNSLHIGTLSWDILLVTLFLMCVTDYHGNYFSLDSIRLRPRDTIDGGGVARRVAPEERPLPPASGSGPQRALGCADAPTSRESHHAPNERVETQGRAGVSREEGGVPAATDPAALLTDAAEGEEPAYRKRRPFFIQRMLQLQMASTYFYTALAKLTAGGNWLTDNPYYYLMHSPPGGVVREFPLRGWLAQHPALCYTIGLGVIVMELMLPTLWFIRRTRLPAIAIGWTFHLLLLTTLHVPTIFFFLFPSQMLLFIPPEDVVAWIERRRHRCKGQQGTLIYDGHCMFCVGSVRRLLALDLFSYLRPVDYQTTEDVTALHPSLTRDQCHAQIHLVEPNGRLSGGFAAIQRLSMKLSLLWLLAPLANLPGARLIGDPAYRWIARHRYLFHRHRACDDNQCVPREAHHVKREASEPP